MPVTEYYLTESDSLFITTQSGTKAAIQLTKEMIRVFMLARRGLLPQPVQAVQQIPAAIADALVKITETVAESQKTIVLIQTALVKLQDRVDGMDKSAGLFGKEKRALYLKEMRQIATLWYPDRKTNKREWRSCRCRIERDARKAAALSMGRAWDEALLSRESDLKLKLVELYNEAEFNPEARRRREEYKTPTLFRN